MSTKLSKPLRLLLVTTLGLAPILLAWTMHGDVATPVDAAPVEAGSGEAAAVDAHTAAPRDAVTAPAGIVGFYGAPVGLSMRHAVATSSTTTLEARRGGVSSLQVDLAGEMTITVLARRDGELVAEVVFPVLAGTLTTKSGVVPIASDSAVSSDLGKPVQVHMRDDGETLGFRFAAGIAADHRNLVRGMWSALRFSPRAEAAGWRCYEQDLLGTADVEYRWQQPSVDGARIRGGTLRKQRLGFASTSSAGTLTGNGDGEASFDPQLGWFAAARWQENACRDVDDAGIKVVTSLRATCRLIGTDRRDPGTEVQPWLQPWQPVAAEASTDGDAHAAERQRRRLAGVTVEQLLADLAALAGRGDMNGPEGHARYDDLMWLLRTQPAAMARLQQLLPGLDPALAHAALAAFGATQLPAAQALLAATFVDGSQPMDRRIAAAMAMVQVQQPTSDVVQRFAAALRDASAFDDGAVAGMLALGTMAGRSATTDQPPAITDLLRLETKAQQHGALAAWLEALGNAAVTEALAAAARHRQHADPAVRVAAVSAVRNVRSDAAWQFAAAMLQDGEPVVRARAAEVLAGRREAAAIAPLVTLLRGEPDARVRRAAIAALSLRSDEAAVAALLHDIASGDADAEVREAAAAALAHQ